jgi:hypothetical protein
MSQGGFPEKQMLRSLRDFLRSVWWKRSKEAE